MAKPFITIIGLGATGASLGQALRKEPRDFEVVGHDKGSSPDADARRAGAVDRTEWNLHRAVEGASIVVIAIPLPEVAETLRLIEEDIAPNTLVMIFTALMRPALDAAQQYLPRHSRVVVAHVVQSIGASTAAPLADATLCIASTVSTDPAAMELASDFADRVGATPHFMDSDEHDGILALVEQTPQVFAAALLAASVGSAGWQESRRLAGRRWAQATDLGGGWENLAAALLKNRTNVVRRLEQLRYELARWQDLLETEAVEGQPHPLADELRDLAAERATWEGQAHSHNWEDAPPADSPHTGGMLRQLFLGNMGRRKPPSANP